MPRAACALVLTAAIAVGLAVGARRSPDARTPGAVIGSVVRVVDGDTIVVALPDGQRTVRYIGIDTPETKRPDTPVQCFGARASARNARLVAGRRVRLVPDAEPVDRYGRTLAYVYRVEDGRFVNAELMRGGFARPLPIRPNLRHADEFARFASTARRRDAGLWGACPR